MPGIDGYETCRRLKADGATGEIPVLFMSGQVEIEDKMQGFKLAPRLAHQSRTLTFASGSRKLDFIEGLSTLAGGQTTVLSVSERRR